MTNGLSECFEKKHQLCVKAADEMGRQRSGLLNDERWRMMSTRKFAFPATHSDPPLILIFAGKKHG